MFLWSSFVSHQALGLILVHQIQISVRTVVVSRIIALDPSHNPQGSYPQRPTQKSWGLFSLSFETLLKLHVRNLWDLFRPDLIHMSEGNVIQIYRSDIPVVLHFETLLSHLSKLHGSHFTCQKSLGHYPLKPFSVICQISMGPNLSIRIPWITIL